MLANLIGGCWPWELRSSQGRFSNKKINNRRLLNLVVAALHRFLGESGQA